MKAKVNTFSVLLIVPLLAACLFLSGCTGALSLDEDSIQDAANTAAETATNLADSAEDAADAAEMLAGLEFDNTSRVVVLDAKTGKTIKEITDQTAIVEALSPLSQENSIALTPDSPKEYIFEFWGPETVKAGQDPSDVSDVKLLEITTYQGSDAITINMVVLGGISLSMTPPDGAESLRNLVNQQFSKLTKIRLF